MIKSRYEYFCSLVKKNIKFDSVVVEVGAGAGLCKHVQKIKESAAKLIGVDPSRNIFKNPYVDEKIVSYFEEAPIDDDSVDVIYSIYVMEHIAKPEIFFNKVYKTLRKGGKMFFITPNKCHYFVLFSGWPIDLR